MPQPSANPTLQPSPAPTASPTATLPNICLSNPEDIYRTCFQRSSDPNNDLTEDVILRDKYNIGAFMHENGEDTSSPSTDTYLAPYTVPYASSEEELSNGTVYVSLVTNNFTNLTCDDQIDLEEITLEWLKVNLGGPDTFSPVCVFNDGYAFHEEANNGTVIETAAFKMDFVFVSKPGWLNETDNSTSGFGRRLNSNKCEDLLKTCCTADVINGADGTKETKKWCKKNGCNPKKCPVNSKRRQLSLLKDTKGFHITHHLRSSHSARRQLIDEDDLLGTEFNDVLGTYTDLDPVSTGAVLGDNETSLEDIAVCRASNYNVTEYGTPTLGCGEYNESSCAENDYIIVASNETGTNQTDACLPEVPTLSPVSSSPTTAPTSKTTTLRPTTRSPTASPTVSPMATYPPNGYTYLPNWQPTTLPPNL